MNTLKITKESKQVYDVEWVGKPSLLLKGIGKTCEVCGRHIFGRANKKTCSNKCRYKKGNDKHRESKNKIGLHAFILLKKSNTKVPYRVIKVYLKRGVIEELKITPDSKALWNLLERISTFRTNPIVEVTS